MVQDPDKICIQTRNLEFCSAKKTKGYVKPLKENDERGVTELLMDLGHYVKRLNCGLFFRTIH